VPREGKIPAKRHSTRLIGGALLIGALLGGRDRGARSVMTLGTAQRNVSAAIVVTSQNFAGTMTLPYVLVAAIVLLLALLPVAGRIGRGLPSPVEGV
jgi:hypothetical protein